MKNLRHHVTRGYSLIEVLAASAIVGMGMAAVATLSATVLVQEELSWRVSVALNHQENAARLFLLGFHNVAPASNPGEPTISSLLPSNPVLDEILVATGSTHVTPTSTAVVNDALAGTLETSDVSATIRNYDSAGVNGSTTIMSSYRPRPR
jgi:prepilin-type N-terminal cleavage/methylation domain-containing protein